jgi:hypothetical protein
MDSELIKVVGTAVEVIAKVEEHIIKAIEHLDDEDADEGRSVYGDQARGELEKALKEIRKGRWVITCRNEDGTQYAQVKENKITCWHSWWGEATTFLEEIDAQEVSALYKQTRKGELERIGVKQL